MDWETYWEQKLPAFGSPTSAELLASPFVQARAPAALRAFWKRAQHWEEPDLRVCIAPVGFSRQHRAPIPGGFTFGHNFGHLEGWRGLFLDLDNYCGQDEGAVMAWVPEGCFEHLFFASPSLEALLQRLDSGKRLSLRALGAVQASRLKKVLKRGRRSVVVTSPSVDRPKGICLSGGVSNAVSWFYSVVGSLELPGMGLQLADQASLRQNSEPFGHWIGEDSEADYVVTRATMGGADGRLHRVPKDGAPPTELGYLLDVVRQWVEAVT
jgi:hypothetical protein